MSNGLAAFLWDESFLWGLMAYNALKECGIPFELVRAEDIRKGVLGEHEMLFVPGGWASNKSRALGEDGKKAIRDFVDGGGKYLGFCGGAGLATQTKGCMGLLRITRRPTRDRVPSFSGRIYLNVKEHPVWKGLLQGEWVRGKGQDPKQSSLVTHDSELIFHAWWPSQFVIEDESVSVLARYGMALPDAFSSDLNVGDVESCGDWSELEEMYQIYLDPRRIMNEPAVIEGTYGKGKVVLSLVHFDTPDDANGQRVLVNLWEYLLGERFENKIQDCTSNKYLSDIVGAQHAVSLRLQKICSELLALGERNFLWFWRNKMILQWRRGVRGLEYNTLYIMMNEIWKRTERRTKNKDGISKKIEQSLERITEQLIPFIERSNRLLVLERYELQKGNHITYDKCDVPEIKELREELFSSSKSHGGMFKELTERLDEVLYILL